MTDSDLESRLFFRHRNFCLVIRLNLLNVFSNNSTVALHPTNAKEIQTICRKNGKKSPELNQFEMKYEIRKKVISSCKNLEEFLYDQKLIKDDFI